jgi:hypothetical protein
LSVRGVNVTRWPGGSLRVFTGLEKRGVNMRLGDDEGGIKEPLAADPGLRKAKDGGGWV